jgi:hypothetical protein
LDPERRRVLSEFYREEFLRQLQHLRGVGILTEEKSEAAHAACDRFLRDLDAAGWRADYAAVAEALLQRFDTLTRLSELDPRSGH